jgi:hypothetical protein
MYLASQSLKDLPAEVLRMAEEAATGLLDNREYLPGDLFPLLLERWREDLWEVLGMEREALPVRSLGPKPLGELTMLELDAMTGTAKTLLEDRFKAGMDDPDLPKMLADFMKALNAEAADRKQLRESMQP